jgi:TRAP-type C4-dicarboxylate transport system permease small subunit
MTIFTALIVGIAVCLTVLAFTVGRDSLAYSGMLHSVALLVWMVATWVLIDIANEHYSTTEYAGHVGIVGATGLFGFSMVLIHIVSILLPYIRERKSPRDAYNERQSAFKLKIANMTKKKKNYWDEW